MGYLRGRSVMGGVGDGNDRNAKALTGIEI